MLAHLFHLSQQPQPLLETVRIRRSMKEILTLFVLLIGIGAIAVCASIAMPAPDGVVFAYTILLSAIAVTLLICAGLSKGRINEAGDILRAIENRRPLCLTAAAYALGCSTIACATVLLFRFAEAL